MADAAAAQPLPLEPPQQQPASTPKEIKIETDLALDIPGGRGAGDWTVKGTDMRGNVQFTRPIPGGGLETRELSKEMYKAVRDLPQNRKRIKTKRASSDNQSITLDNKEDIRVVGFDAATRQVLVEGTINGNFTQEWIPSASVDKAVRNDPNGLADLTRVLAPNLGEKRPAQEQSKENEQAGTAAATAKTTQTTQEVSPGKAPSEGTATVQTSVQTSVAADVQTTRAPSPITELRAELRVQKQTQKQSGGAVSTEASIAANDNAVANDNGVTVSLEESKKTAALSGLSNAASKLTVTQQRQKQDDTRIAEEQAQVAKALNSVQQQLQQPQLSQDERAGLEQQRGDLTARQTRLNGERASVSVAQVQSDQQLADIQQAQQAIEQGAPPEDYASLIPQTTLLQGMQGGQAPGQQGPRVAVAQQQNPSAAAQPGAVVAIGLPPDDASGAVVLATAPSAAPRIRTGVPATPKQGRGGQTTALPKSSASPTPIKPLQDNALSARGGQSGGSRTNAPSSDGYNFTGPSVPVQDPFDLQTPSYTQGSLPEPVDEADAQAQKLGTFQEQQQRQRRTSQQFSGLPEGDVLGQSQSSGGGERGVTMRESGDDASMYQDEEEEEAEQPAQSQEETEAARADEFQEQTARDRLQNKKTQAVQEAAQKQKDQMKQQIQKELQAAFQKLKTGSKAGSVSVVLILVYLLVLHIQMINKCCWPKSKYIPDSKMYEDLLCIVFDILILILWIIQIKFFLIPFEMMGDIFRNMGLSDVLSAAWGAATQ